MANLFYFNSVNDHPDLDPDGIELPDLAAAQKEALRLLGRMLQDADGDGLWHGKDWSVWVTDAPSGTGHILFKLHLSATKPHDPA
ncbi:MAG: hypothetical protein JO289_17185 [Xanthobacteraceae bacterium]|nr:hypothetical protein [Xanthobacteraceae bacterium]